MAFQNFKDNFDDAFEHIKRYLNIYVTNVKLRSIKKATHGVTAMLNVLLWGTFALLALFFLSIALCVGIGNWVDSYMLGFVIVGGFYLLLMILALLFGRRIIRNSVLRFLLSKIFDKEEVE